MVLSEAGVTNGFKRGRVITRIRSRNVTRGVGMWVISYELSTRVDDWVGATELIVKLKTKVVEK